MVLRRCLARGFKREERVLRRVLRRGSRKGLSRSCLEGRNTPFKSNAPFSCALFEDRKTHQKAHRKTHRDTEWFHRNFPPNFRRAFFCNKNNKCHPKTTSKKFSQKCMMSQSKLQSADVAGLETSQCAHLRSKNDPDKPKISSARSSAPLCLPTFFEGPLSTMAGIPQNSPKKQQIEAPVGAFPTFMDRFSLIFLARLGGQT